MKKSTIKNFIIIIVIVAVLLVLYIMFIKPDSSSSNQGTLTSSSGNQVTPAATDQSATPSDSVNQQLLDILTSLESITLNDSILSNPAFALLEDISKPLIREGNEGRRNPFAPIGSDPVITETSAIQVTTLSNDSDDSSAQAETPSQSESTDSSETSPEPELDIFGLPVSN